MGELLCSQKDCSLVNSLSAVLKGDVHDEHLTLSARSLQILYEGFRQIQTSSCVTLSHMDMEQKLFTSLKHLYEFVQNAKGLKVFENGETLQGHVNCTDFTSISNLEVKCLPLYQFYGLSKLAPNLSVITCIGCITRIQELFEQCGAETFRASQVLWAKLTEAHLSYNNLQSLDNSLRLVSNIKILDLSHNNLSTTDNYLIVLNNLEVLNLSYNSLVTFPEIALSAKCRIMSLNLRNNLLTSLKNLERLVCLRSLDISDNLLTNVKSLNQLKSLLMLHCLVTSGNPVSFHLNYRQIVINCLHPAVLSQVSFDGHPLTKLEKQQFHATHIPRTTITAPTTSTDFINSIDSGSFSLDTIESQRRTAKKRRPRLVEIGNENDEHGTSQKYEDSTEVSDSVVVSRGQSSAYREIDVSIASGSERSDYSDGLSLRRQMSSLSKKSSRKGFQNDQKRIYPNSSISSREQSNFEISGNRLHLIGSSDGEAMAAAAANSIVDENVSAAAVNIQEVSSSNGHLCDMPGFMENCLLCEDAINDHDDIILNDNTNEVIGNSKMTREIDSTGIIMKSPASDIIRGTTTLVLEMVTPAKDVVDSFSKTSLPDDDKVTIYSTAEKLSVLQNSLENEPLSGDSVTLNSLIDNGFDGDFIVNYLDGHHDNTQCIISIIDNWLYVRNTVALIERLDLRALLMIKRVSSDVTWRKERLSSLTPDDSGPAVHLVFDTVRQNMKERLYTLKDENETKKFVDLLKSFIRPKETKKMQCLKCSLSFKESEGILKQKIHADVQYSDISKAVKNKMIVHCPKCESHMIIEETETASHQTILSTSASFGKTKDIKKHSKGKKHKRIAAQSYQQMPSVSLSSSYAQMNTGSVAGNQSTHTIARESTDSHVARHHSLSAFSSYQRDANDASLPLGRSRTDKVQFFFESTEN